MRDIAVFLTLLGTIPFILYRPWIGVLVLAWLGYMNPHRLAYGFVTDMPVVFIVVIVLLVALLFTSKEERGKIPFSREVIILIIFLIWMFITTIFAVHNAAAWIQWDKVWKIQMIIFPQDIVHHGGSRGQFGPDADSLFWTRRPDHHPSLQHALFLID